MKSIGCPGQALRGYRQECQPLVKNIRSKTEPYILSHGHALSLAELGILQVNPAHRASPAPSQPPTATRLMGSVAAARLHTLACSCRLVVVQADWANLIRCCADSSDLSVRRRPVHRELAVCTQQLRPLLGRELGAGGNWVDHQGLAGAGTAIPVLGAPQPPRRGPQYDDFGAAGPHLHLDLARSPCQIQHRLCRVKVVRDT